MPSDSPELCAWKAGPLGPVASLGAEGAADMSNEIPILIVGPWLMASKRKSHREQVRAIMRSLSTFLQDNGLVTREILPEGAEITEDLVIKKSDLTAEGYALYHAAVEKKWMEAIDRGVDPTNTEILRKALVAIRSGQKSDKSSG